VRTSRALAAGLAEEGMRVVSGGTDSHLSLIDLRPVNVGGKEAEKACDEVGIALNKNAIPFDPMPPGTPSGIRVGTPGISTLGMDEAEAREIAGIIGETVRNPDDDAVKQAQRKRVTELTSRFPAYAD
jgi:glycine hydroxymethyltransferase